MLESDAVRFATLEEGDRISTDQSHVFQIQHDAPTVGFQANQRFQLGMLA
jgi:hypothetical protein